MGTVIKCGEEDDPIGVASVLSLAPQDKCGQGGLAALGQLRSYLERHCPDDATRKRLAAAWAAPATGLVLDERLMNCPPQLAPPLVEGLFAELAAAAADEDLAPARRQALAFRQYLVLVRAYTDPLAAARDTGPSGSGGSKQQQQKKQKTQQAKTSKMQMTTMMLKRKKPSPTNLSWREMINLCTTKIRSPPRNMAKQPPPSC